MIVVYILPVINEERYSVSYLGYKFKPKKPVEVPEEIGNILLEMETSPCRCHKKKPEKLFQKLNK